MARLPISEEDLIARYGPHLNEAPPGGWDAGLEVDRVVNTHCCFCGQQCGIKLKVHQNEVVGFDYRGVDGEAHFQDTCPRCRRASVTLAQSARVGGFG